MGDKLHYRLHLLGHCFDDRLCGLARLIVEASYALTRMER